MSTLLGEKLAEKMKVVAASVQLLKECMATKALQTVTQEMAKQLLFSTPSIYPAEANRTLLSLFLAITGPKEGTMSDFGRWFGGLLHAGVAADAFGHNLLIAARGSSRMQVFLPVATVWAPGA